MKTYKISEKQYLKNPEKWAVQFVGWYINGNPFAVCTKVKQK